MANRVAVIDYGMGNIHSVTKALQHVGGDVQVIATADPEVIRRADHVVLPGVGAMGDCMNELLRLELDEVVRECFTSKPFLGICVGMQVLFDYGEESDGVEGFGLIPGQVKHFTHHINDNRLKIPHMGWNEVHQQTDHPIWQSIEQDSRFYFVHSYFTVPKSKVDNATRIQATTEYGGDFVSAVGRDNAFAVQFHPEKSQHVGLQLLANFLQWDGAA